MEKLKNVPVHYSVEEWEIQPIIITVLKHNIGVAHKYTNRGVMYTLASQKDRSEGSYEAHHVELSCGWSVKL